jgi:hypothetical protein
VWKNRLEFLIKTKALLISFEFEFESSERDMNSIIGSSMLRRENAIPMACLIATIAFRRLNNLKSLDLRAASEKEN